MAMAFVAAFPEYSLRWLLSGEGDRMVQAGDDVIELLKNENEQFRKDNDNLWELVKRLSEK